MEHGQAMNNLTTKIVATAAFFLVALFLLIAGSFALHQNLWVDESTQLSGLSLSFVDIYRWLGALIDNPFPVPSDRMPVLSYWLGAAWAVVFGLDVLAMRWFSIVLVASSLCLLTFFLLRRGQPVVLFSSLLFLCLSPNLTIIAVEIRAYALFFLLSVVAILLYIDIIWSREKGQNIDRHILVLIVVLALAINTHFFGLVLCGSLLLTYLLTTLFDKRFEFKAQYFWLASVLLSLAILFIVLPVMASFTSQAGGKSSQSIVGPAVKLIYRLVSHQSMQSVSWFPFAALAIFYLTIVFSLIKKISLIKVSLIIILASGFTVVFIANIFLSNFDALAPHYNIWMLAVIALLFGFSVADLLPTQQWVVCCLLALLLGFGQYTLAVSGEKYAHNRFDQIQARVEQYEGSDNLAIIYNKPMAKTWFASLYSFSPSIGQFIVTPEGYVNLRTDTVESQQVIEQQYNIIISAYGENIYSDVLAASQASFSLADNSVAYTQLVLPKVQWQVVDAMGYMAQESAEIVVYKKTP